MKESENESISLKSIIEMGASVSKNHHKYSASSDDFEEWGEDSDQNNLFLFKCKKTLQTKALQFSTCGTPLEILYHLRGAMNEESLSKKTLIDFFDFLILNYDRYLQGIITEVYMLGSSTIDDDDIPGIIRDLEQQFDYLGPTSSDHWEFLKSEIADLIPKAKGDKSSWRDSYLDYPSMNKKQN